MPSAAADAVVVGGGTIGAWCAYFLRQAGLDQVIVLEKRTLGQGASSRAAGIVRTQGGTTWAVQLGEWSRRFYLSQQERLGIDSGFTAQGYVLPCFTEEDVDAARDRMAMQNALGLAVRWLEPAELDGLNPTLAPGLTRGGTYCAQDGYLTPPRNVTAYAVALAISGVEVREHTAFTGLDIRGGRVAGVQTSQGRIESPRVVLTGGPELAEVAGMSRTVFAARFTSAMARPPIEFLKGLRFARAAHLLARTDLPVKAIASRVGYASRSSFTRAFVAHHGAPPTDFRDTAADR